MQEVNLRDHRIQQLTSKYYLSGLSEGYWLAPQNEIEGPQKYLNANWDRESRPMI